MPSGLWAAATTSVSIEMWYSSGINNDCTRLFELGTNGYSFSGLNIIVYRACWLGSPSALAASFPQWDSSSAGETSVAFDGQSDVHFVITLAPGDYGQVYVNGELVGRTSQVITALPAPNYFYIGT